MSGPSEEDLLLHLLWTALIYWLCLFLPTLSVACFPTLMPPSSVIEAGFKVERSKLKTRVALHFMVWGLRMKWFVGSQIDCGCIAR